MCVFFFISLVVTEERDPIILITCLTVKVEAGDVEGKCVNECPGGE